ncbi:MAG: hypothetical protein HRT45_10620 [Bdellovibrionales bacterium]|nr:hypothetical protein [Bdellovibrionales bacterium]
MSSSVLGAVRLRTVVSIFVGFSFWGVAQAQQAVVAGFNPINTVSQAPPSSGSSQGTARYIPVNFPSYGPAEGTASFNPINAPTPSLPSYGPTQGTAGFNPIDAPAPHFDTRTNATL